MKRSLLLCLFAACQLFGETVVEADEADYDGSQIHLRGHVFVTNETGKLYAETAYLDMEKEGEKYEANYIKLDGKVKLIDSEENQFVLSDHVEIFPDQNVIIFQANDGERVLFLDRAKQMQLAAHKIRVERGEKDIVQGYGDVRCVFAADELDRIKSQFALD